MIRGVILLMSAVVCLLIVAFAVMRSLGNAEQPQASFACATKLYSTYDPKNLEQCMAVCVACSAGVKTTCSTSCKLRGAR
nr:hypothetical protein [Afipia massiliensis]